MEKKTMSGYEPLPSYSPQPPPSRRNLTSKPLKLISAFIFISLISYSSAQLLFPANVVQAPFNSPSSPSSSSPTKNQGDLYSSDGPEVRAPRIAIIGAGAGGSSAAYFLNHFKQLKDLGLESDVEVFEKDSFVGGRSQPVWPWKEEGQELVDDGEREEDWEPVEMGASIFVDANKNMMKASKVFGLELWDHESESGGMGIYDGEKIVFSQWGKTGYWDIAKMFWRYGRAPLRVRSLVKKTVDSFQRLYTPTFLLNGPFSSISSFAYATNLSDPSSLSSTSYFEKESVSGLFVQELVAAATAVNYGTPANRIHGVGALVSMAAEGASAVRGGNRQIFEKFVADSGAKLRLGEEVVEIVKLDESNVTRRAKWVLKTSKGIGGTFDAIILASPFHQTGISLINTFTPTDVPPQSYVPLHVSFVITNISSPLPSYFSLSPKNLIPTSIFATFDTSSTTKPRFNSMNYIKPIPLSYQSKFGMETPSLWHVVKMFSSKKLEMEDVEEVFGKGNVGKVYRKLWNAYPVLEPIEKEEDLAKVRLDEGFYYVNAFERLISTMETETVAAFNVVSLLLKDFYDYQPPKSWAEWDEE